VRAPHVFVCVVARTGHSKVFDALEWLAALEQRSVMTTDHD